MTTTIPDTSPARAPLLNQLVYVLLLVIIVVTAIPYGTVHPWWISAFECSVFLTAMLALLEIVINRASLPKLSLALPIFALALFALGQSFPLFPSASLAGAPGSLSADPHSSSEFSTRLIALTIFSLMLSRYACSKSRLRTLFYVIIGVGVASALFGLARQSLQKGTGFLLPGLPPGDRGFAQFINRNHFAMLIEMSLGLTLGLVAGEARKYRQVFVMLPIALLLWVALVFSNSRGGIFASFCEILFMAMMLDPVRQLEIQHGGGSRLKNLSGRLIVRVMLVICLLAVFVYAVRWIGGEPVVSNFQAASTDFAQQETDNNINTNRKQIWSATWQMIKDHPIAGVGFGGYWMAISQYHHASGEMTPQQAHNDYLELLASGGVIGVALVIWALVVFLRKVWHGPPVAEPFARAARLGAVTGLFGICLHSFVDFGLHITINALVFFALMVIAVSASSSMCHEVSTTSR